MNGDNDEPHYGVADESDLDLLESTSHSLIRPKNQLQKRSTSSQPNVDVKVLTGDSELVAQYVCNHVGMKTERILLGPEIEKLTDDELASVASGTTLSRASHPCKKKESYERYRKRGM